MKTGGADRFERGGVEDGGRVEGDTCADHGGFDGALLVDDQAQHHLRFDRGRVRGKRHLHWRFRLGHGQLEAQGHGLLAGAAVGHDPVRLGALGPELVELWPAVPALAETRTAFREQGRGPRQETHERAAATRFGSLTLASSSTGLVPGSTCVRL